MCTAVRCCMVHSHRLDMGLADDPQKPCCSYRAALHMDSPIQRAMDLVFDKAPTYPTFDDELNPLTTLDIIEDPSFRDNVAGVFASIWNDSGTVDVSPSPDVSSTRFHTYSLVGGKDSDNMDVPSATGAKTRDKSSSSDGDTSRSKKKQRRRTRWQAGRDYEVDTETGRIKCTQCPLTFVRSDGMRRHVDSAHDRKKSYNCRTCDKSFSRVDHAAKHERVCSGPKKKND